MRKYKIPFLYCISLVLIGSLILGGCISMPRPLPQPLPQPPLPYCEIGEHTFDPELGICRKCQVSYNPIVKQEPEEDEIEKILTLFDEESRLILLAYHRGGADIFDTSSFYNIYFSALGDKTPSLEGFRNWLIAYVSYPEDNSAWGKSIKKEGWYNKTRYKIIEYIKKREIWDMIKRNYKLLKRLDATEQKGELR